MKSGTLLAVLGAISLTTLATAASAKDQTYMCMTSDPSVEARQDLSITAKGLSLKFGESKGKIDKKYKPRANTSYLRYDLEDCAEGSCMLLVDKSLIKGGAKLKDGKKGGFVKLQWQGESFYSSTYVCTVR